MAVDSGANKIYVTSHSNNLWVVDGATNGTSRVDVGYRNYPVAIAVNTATNKVYLSGHLMARPVG
jgi:DNA-binding beta-propeller fold protein YncE